MNLRIFYSKGFIKNFSKRIEGNKKLEKKFEQRIGIFLHDPNHPILRNHLLTGNLKGKSAFSLTGDYRIIYTQDGEDIELLDIGTHAQVYE